MNRTVVGIGELLWDVFPDGRRLGGAPVNFACHCNQLGVTAYPVSCLGEDEPGCGIRNALEALKVDRTYVASDANYPTGTVQVTLDQRGKPSYEICQGVAWDAIPFTPALERLAVKADAACFGSLAQRNQMSRETILSFLGAMRPEALRIFDINLRQSFFTRKIIQGALRISNVLKLSDEELPVLAEMFELAGSAEDQLRSLLQRFGLRLIAYTRGPEGSLLLTPAETDDQPAYPATVVDSVGAGDSFTAAMCVGLLNHAPLAKVNAFANRVAGFVCSQKGATPVFPENISRGYL